jgi:hypothetical protein
MKKRFQIRHTITTSPYLILLFGVSLCYLAFFNILMGNGPNPVNLRLMIKVLFTAARLCAIIFILDIFILF